MHKQKEVLLRDSDSSADSFGSYVPPSLRNASAITGVDVLSSKEALERQHGGRSFRPKKRHNGQRRAKLQKNTMDTLGSGDLRGAVRLPVECSQAEWFSVHVVDFNNELSLFVGMVHDAGGWKTTNRLGQGFPPRFEYRWAARGGDKPQRCSATGYVTHVMDWLANELDNLPEVANSSPAPAEATDAAADDAKFVARLRDMFKRMFRVYAIIYCSQHTVFERLEALPHLNTCFKRFMFFVFEFKLVEDKDLKALEPLTSQLRGYYGA